MMKKEYKTPVAEQVPLMMEQSLCQLSIMEYHIVSGTFDESDPDYD